jgi:hypothetical protein
LRQAFSELALFVAEVANKILRWRTDEYSVECSDPIANSVRSYELVFEAIFGAVVIFL